MEPGARPTEMEAEKVETQAKSRRRRPRVTPMDWRAKAELQACETKVEAGAQQTRAEPVGVRTKVDLEGRRSPAESKGWRDKV